MVIVKRNRKKRRGQRFKPKIINKKLLNILPRKIVLTPTYFAHKLEKQQQKIIIKRIIIIIILLSLSRLSYICFLQHLFRIPLKLVFLLMLSLLHIFAWTTNKTAMNSILFPILTILIYKVQLPLLAVESLNKIYFHNSSRKTCYLIMESI